MKKSFHILLNFCVSFCLAQNLVPNGDFEIYSQCPNNAGQVNYATGWMNATPTTSPDYCNACGISGISVPNGSGGYQNDCCGGNGYMGIFAFAKPFPNDGREYIQIKLNDTLTGGRKYFAKMKVCLTEVSNYAIATLGMNFSDNPITSGNGFINIPNPQVKGITLLTDTMNWMVVQDTVYAVGNELYLTIGNFNTDATSDTFKVATILADISYYYIDDVSVIDVGVIGINELVKQSEINIYPNPSTTSITVSLETNSRALLKDIFGKTIQAINMQPGANNMDVSGLENGLYFLYIENQQEKTTCTRKIFVQH